MDHLQAVQDAILDGRDKQLSTLLQRCTPEAVSAPIDEEGTTLLHLAANTENPQVLSILLDLGVSINSQNGDGFTPLHVAAMWGREECVGLLMERGADPAISDDDEMTPLDYSESEGHSKCVGLLRNWSTPSKENTKNSANIKPSHFPTSNGSPTDRHLSPTLPVTNDHSETTVDQSMAETFVSMYLNMTQVAQDLTEVTQISGLVDSPSLLDILTTHHGTPPCDSSRLALEPQDEEDTFINSVDSPLPSSPPSHSAELVSSPEELYTTAVEPTAVPAHTSITHNTPATSPVPFLAESLKKIALRRQALRASKQSIAQSHTTSPVSPTVPCKAAENICQQHRTGVERIPQSHVLPPPSERLYLTPTVRERDIASNGTTNAVKPVETGREKHTPVEHSEIATASSSFQTKSKECGATSGHGRPQGNPKQNGHYQSHSSPASSSDTKNRVSQKPEEKLPCVSAREEDDTKRSLKTAPHGSSLLANCSVAADITTQIPCHLHGLTNQELRQRLIARGEQPGPVTELTRSAYLVYLAKLEAGIQPAGNTGYKGYKYELALVLNGTAPVPDFSALEYEVFRQYRMSRLPNSPLRTLPSITAPAFPLPRTLVSSLPTSPRSKRDWSTKTHFNYLLLDPSQLGQLNRGERDSIEHFRVFVEAVFYVGKGKNARSLQHLKDAREKMHLPKTKLSAKHSRIISIWNSGQGVVSLHIFHHTTAEEAFTREACMIDAIGLDMITNIQKGHMYGEVSHWGCGKRRQFGVFLLHKAYLCYLLDPPQPVGQDDL